MSDEAKPVEQTPAAAPAADESVDKPAETTPAPAAAETEAPAVESKPAEEETPAATEDKPAETAAPAEEKKPTPKEVEPVYSGPLSFKGPANFPKYVNKMFTHRKFFLFVLFIFANLSQKPFPSEDLLLVRRRGCPSKQAHQFPPTLQG